MSDLDEQIEEIAQKMGMMRHIGMIGGIVVEDAGRHQPMRHIDLHLTNEDKEQKIAAAREEINAKLKAADEKYHLTAKEKSMYLDAVMQDLVDKEETAYGQPGHPADNEAKFLERLQQNPTRTQRAALQRREIASWKALHDKPLGGGSWDDFLDPELQRMGHSEAAGVPVETKQRRHFNKSELNKAQERVVAGTASVEEIKGIQRELKAEGFDIGKTGAAHDGVDGDAGSLTRNALLIKAEEHIAAGTASVEEIEAVQRKLKAEGFDIGKTGANHDGVDGDAGALTKKALKKAVFVAVKPM